MTDTMTYNWNGNAGGLSVGRRQSAAYASSPLHGYAAPPSDAPADAPLPDDDVVDPAPPPEPDYVEPDAPVDQEVDYSAGEVEDVEPNEPDAPEDAPEVVTN